MPRRLLIAACFLVWPLPAMAELTVSVKDAPPLAAPARPETPAPPPSPPADAPEASNYNSIVLQGLNKVTGHISRLEGPVGTAMHFGNLEIIARRCWKSSPEDRPENAALLDISEMTPGEPPHGIFLGWMFSSSPGLSSLEHPVYDITVLNCVPTREPKEDDEDKPDDKKAAKTEKKADKKK